SEAPVFCRSRARNSPAGPPPIVTTFTQGILAVGACGLQARCAARPTYYLSGLPRPEAAMAVKLEKSIKRELDMDGRAYTITIAPEGVKVVEKGKRKGREISWRSIVSGDAQLAEDLKISIGA